MLAFCYEMWRLPPYQKDKKLRNEVAKYKQIDHTHVDDIAE